MRPNLLSHVRSALLALGLTAGLSIPAMAVPAGIAAPALAGVGTMAGGDGNVTLARDGVRYKNRGHYRTHGQYAQRNWNRGSSHWSGQRYARNHNHYNRHQYRYRHDNYRYRYDNYRYRYGPGIYLGLGVPIYRYVQPRPYYRTYGGSSAHVAWCYDRYRSYRARDNTFQPYNGPRRQCWSPYS